MFLYKIYTLLILIILIIVILNLYFIIYRNKNITPDDLFYNAYYIVSIYLWSIQDETKYLLNSLKYLLIN